MVACLAAVALLAVTAPVAAQGPPEASVGDQETAAAPASAGPGSAALVAQADALAAQLPAARLALDSAVAAEETAERDAGSAGEGLAERRRADERTEAALGELAVAAYTSGGVVPDELVAELLTSEQASVQGEARLIMVQTVADTLVDRRRVTSAGVTEAEQAVAQARTRAAEAERRVAEVRATYERLVADEAATRRAAAEARAAEEAEAARLAFEALERSLREAQLRAATPVPTSHRSGVVPAVDVPALLAARVGGEIPATALAAYWRAAAIARAGQPGCGVDWALLAAIGKVETDHGRFRGTVVAADGSTAPVLLGPPLDGGGGFLRILDTDAGRLDGDPIVDRAVGPMQFIPRTWGAYAADGNGDGIADPHNQYDAAVAAGRYLCRSGGGWGGDAGSVTRAVLAYNRSTAYLTKVLGLADHYRVLADPTAASTTTTLGEIDLPDEDEAGRPTLDEADPAAGETTTTTTATGPGGTGTTTTSSPSSTTSTTTSTTTTSSSTSTTTTSTTTPTTATTEPDEGKGGGP